MSRKEFEPHFIYGCFVQTQVFRYCLNLNFREEYRVYDDIFALLHDDVQLGKIPTPKRGSYG